MAYGLTPGPEGSSRARRLHPKPWPLNPASQGALPGPLGRYSTSALDAALELVPERPPRPLSRTAEGASRPLRGGEVRMAYQVFGDSLNYSLPRIHNDEFLPFGLQPNNTAMTPNGSMYFNPSRFKEDFSLSNEYDKHWFMHEMVHIWQHQLGYPVMARGAIRIGLSYEYELEAGKSLGDYNMEAQGDLVADYFALEFLKFPDTVSQDRYRNSLPFMKQVLASFIANPSDKKNLP